MVAIPVDPRHQTVAAVDKAREAKHQHLDSYGIPMSALGTECDRQLWLTFRWASKAEHLTGQKLRLFETGNIEESRLISDLRMVEGVEVQDIDPETGKQYKVYGIGGHLRGKLDGLVKGIPEAPKIIHVLETKSHNQKSFDELRKKGVKQSKPSHFWQCQMYCHLMQLTRCLYLAVNKNTDELYSERIEHDPVACMRMLIRLEHVIQATRAPVPISEQRKAPDCLWCNHKSVCHSLAFGRSNCRTCLHVTPIVDPVNTAGQWLCEKHNKTLTADEQHAGCGDHLFLPDMVPGTQTDSGDDFVIYQMRDGSEWTDRVKPPEPVTRYWWHADSESLLTTADGNPPGTLDGSIEELSAEEYAQAQAYYQGLALAAAESALESAGIPT